MAAPLRSTISIVTTVLLVLLFAVFRLSGGSIKLTSTAQPGSPPPAARVERPVQRVPASADTEADDFVQRLLSKKNEARKAQPSPVHNTQPARGGGLADIEKDLGLK